MHIADIRDPDVDPETWQRWERFHVHRADVRKWAELRAVFDAVGACDFVFANAGAATGDYEFLDDQYDDQGRLAEPQYGDLLTNAHGCLNTIKLAWHSMRKHGRAGSIVLTTGTPAYMPEHSLPVWSSSQAAHVGLVRSLRHHVGRDHITINAVAAHATITRMLMYDLAVPMIHAGTPVSSPEHVALALVFSATARQTRRVDVYGREPDSLRDTPGRWHGRVIVAWGDRYIELEERMADLREQCFGAETLAMFRKQQEVTDMRGE